MDACNTVKFAKAEDPKSFTYPIKNIRILKAQGKSTRESKNVHGYALNCSLANQGMFSGLPFVYHKYLQCDLSLSLSLSHSAMNKQLKNAKIACLDFSLQKVKMKLGVQVLINEPSELEAIRKR